jgi:hypothetical protein
VQGELGVGLGLNRERLGIGHVPMEHVVLFIVLILQIYY